MKLLQKPLERIHSVLVQTEQNHPAQYNSSVALKHSVCDVVWHELKWEVEDSFYQTF